MIQALNIFFVFLAPRDNLRSRARMMIRTILTKIPTEHMRLQVHRYFQEVLMLSERRFKTKQERVFLTKETRQLRTPETREIVEYYQQSKSILFLKSAIAFVNSLGLQLGKTLLATSLKVLADFIVSKSDNKAKEILRKHDKDENAKQESINSQKLYGDNYSRYDSRYYGKHRSPEQQNTRFPGMH